MVQDASAGCNLLLVPSCSFLVMSRPINTSTPLGRVIVDRHLSVGGFSRDTGISERMLSYYLAGTKTPDLYAQAVIADRLGLDPSHLFPTPEPAQ